ncbi:MAG: hypothetical protein KAT77_04680 [Nanoarchaeota archaeon]|nr:hypothetical protein [Nanoarchaeota archaeon]
MEYTTLIEKECGHFGLIQNKLPNEMVQCSQCELNGGKGRVKVIQSKLIDSGEVPELDFSELDKWIGSQLIDRT